MPIEWEITRQTKAPLSKAIEYYMNPEVHVAKVHPKLVKEVKILGSDANAVTWEQHYTLMGMNLKSIVRSSLNKATNTIETLSVSGTRKGTSMTRTLKAIPTGTEVNYVFRPKLGPLGFFLAGPFQEGFRSNSHRGHHGYGQPDLTHVPGS